MQALTSHLETVTIYRDGPNSSWGIRLKGGCDVEGGTPLEIIKVFPGDACDGILRPGDQITSINYQDVSNKTHREAQSLMKNSGSSVQLQIIRSNVQTQVKPFPCQKSDSFSNGGGSHSHSSKFKHEVDSTSSKQHLLFSSRNQQYFADKPKPENSKIINIGGEKRQIVSNQFNSPIKMYSDQAIAEAALVSKTDSLEPSKFSVTADDIVDPLMNKCRVGAASKSHLPTPRDSCSLGSRPQESETFKMVLESEMKDSCDGQEKVLGQEFQKSKIRHETERPQSTTTNMSQKYDPLLMDTSINQSATFKKVMLSVMGQTDF